MVVNRSFGHRPGRTGIQEIPNEQAVVNSLKTNITADGLYLFPGWGLPATASHSQKMDAMKNMGSRIKAGPTGILVYHPAGQDPIPLKSLVIELETNILQMMLAVLLLGQTNLTSFGARWRFITITGILAAVSTNISYWNWYGFPGSYTRAYIATIVVGFAIAGLVAAALVKPEAKSMAATR